MYTAVVFEIPPFTTLLSTVSFLSAQLFFYTDATAIENIILHMLYMYVFFHAVKHGIVINTNLKRKKSPVDFLSHV